VSLSVFGSQFTIDFAQAIDRVVACSKASNAGREAIVLKKLLRVVIAILVPANDLSQRFREGSKSETSDTTLLRI
jgi:hypothetical protein